jgi:BCD family chlorophyll transporter-like MFS transporter
LHSSTTPRFSFLRTLKIASFNLGSAIVDILTASVWNRVLISDLGAGAAPVSMLLGLRYLLAPLSIWVGVRSDTRPIFGLRRLPYIWMGRLMMLAAIVLLPISTTRLASDVNDPIGWGMALAIFVFYGLGTASSGGPFLALIHDSTPAERRGLAISLAQTLLLAGFAVSPIIFARVLPSYTPERFQSVAVGAGLVAGAIWLLSIVGEERRARPGEAAPPAKPGQGLRSTLRSMWADSRARGFFFFLSLGAIASFAQDAVLEPFGGDVFGLGVDETTRFNAYFGAAVLATMVITSALTRRRRPEEQSRPAAIGLSVMIAGLTLLAVAGLRVTQWLITPALIVFGLGFGVYTIGGVSLLMAMTTETQAGAYLGLWTMTQLVSRGIGIGLGGIVRDVALWLTGSISLAYSSVFILEAIGLAGCIWLLSRLDVIGFAREQRAVATASPLAAMAD